MLFAWQLVNSKQLSREARYSIPCYVLLSQIAAVSIFLLSNTFSHLLKLPLASNTVFPAINRAIMKRKS